MNKNTRIENLRDGYYRIWHDGRDIGDVSRVGRGQWRSMPSVDGVPLPRSSHCTHTTRRDAIEWLILDERH